MSGKWHVASEPDEADRHLAAAARLRRLLRHHHRRRQLLRPEHADARQREHRARGASATAASSTPTRSATTPSPSSTSTAREHADKPFFLYVAYTAPHWPLHAHDEDIAKYKGRFDDGWDALREERLDKLVACGHPRQRTGSSPTATRRSRRGPRPSTRQLDAALHGGLRGADRPHGPGHRPHPRGAREAPASSTTRWSSSSPTTAAAPRTSREDVTIDELVDKLMIAQVAHAQRRAGALRQRLRRACPGPENTYQSYGTAWANLSNTPFRLYKHWIHEGGISTPLIAHWPDGIAATRARSATRRATCPTSWRRSSTSPARPIRATCDGHADRAARRPVAARRCSRRDGVERPPMFWEHEGNAAVRIGKWKLVRNYPRAVGALRHGGRPHRAARPRGAAARAGRATWRGSTRRGRSAAA